MSRVLLRTSSDVLRRSYLKGAVGTPAGAALDTGGPSMLFRGQFDPSLEINYVDDPRLAVGETFLRATIRTVRDFEGRTITLDVGEAGFWGFRRKKNIVTKSEDISNAAWVKSAAVASSALRLREDGTNAEHRITQLLTNAAGSMAVQCEARRVAGSARNLQLDIQNGGTVLNIKVDLGTGAVLSTLTGGTSKFTQAEVTRSNDRWRICIAGTGLLAASTLGARTLDAAGNLVYQGDNNSEVEVTRLDAQEINGQSFLGCSEYASVGVLPAAPYQGANVDGVQYFVTDYNGVKIKRYTGDVIKYLQLVGQAGGSATTPDTAAVSITGDIDMDVLVAPNSWTPAAINAFIYKYAAGALSFAFAINADGTLQTNYSVDGAAGFGTNSSTPVVWINGLPLYLRVKREAASGDVWFYTSTDGRTWTQLGTVRATTAGAIFDSATAVKVGLASDAVSFPFVGLFYRARIYRGFRDEVGSALVAEFNADHGAAAGAATVTSSTTGEVWTINGNGAQARLNTFTKQGRWGLFGEAAGTNLTLRSDALDDAAYTKTRATAVANAIVGVSGALLGDKLVEDATAGATHIVSQAFVKAAAALAYSYTATLRAGERFAARLDVFNGANGAFARFDLLNQAVLTAGTLFGAGFAAPLASIEQTMPGVYECTLTVTSDGTAALTTQIGLYNAADAYNGDNASGLFVLAQQLEQYPEKTSYIPTGAAAVPRNQELPSFAALGSWFNQAEGAIVVKGMTRSVPAATAPAPASFNDGSNNEAYFLRLNADGARHPIATVNDGGVTQATLTVAEAPAAGVFTRLGLAYKVNDFAAVCDGGVIVTDVAGTLPTPTQAQLLNHVGGSAFNGALARLWIYDKRLPNAPLSAAMAGI